MIGFLNLGFKQYIGEHDTNIRKCRFCGRTEKNAKQQIFGPKDNSHAISYFLGNEKIFCLEECKECNNKFGKTIEIDLAEYYGPLRAMLGKKSRANNPLTSDGINYDYSAGRTRIVATGENEKQLKAFLDNTIKEASIGLDIQHPIILHNIYKVLVKYIIACIPSEYLPFMQDAIDWINGKKNPPKGLLPAIYRIETLNNVDEPILRIYIRNDEKKDMPFCIGELRFLENLYIFAVPYCKKKNSLNIQLEKGLEEFVHRLYPETIFTKENFCDNEKKLITMHVGLSFPDGKSPKDCFVPFQEGDNTNWSNDKIMRMRKQFGKTNLHEGEIWSPIVQPVDIL